MRAWTEHELIAKHVRLNREMKQMIGELVGILKNQKVTVELCETYCHRTRKGLPKAALNDDKKRNGIVLCAKGKVKRYRGFHKRKMDRFQKMIMTLKTYLREWQVLWKEVKDGLVRDFNGSVRIFQTKSPLPCIIPIPNGKNVTAAWSNRCSRNMITRGRSLHRKTTKTSGFVPTRLR